jgi:hypothetical protein
MSIGRYKKVGLLVMGGIAAALVLLFSLLLLLPRLINLEMVRGRILENISEVVGGSVEFEKVDLSFFPRPHAVAHDVRLSLPGKLTGDVHSMAIYPEIFPLFTGRISIALLHVEAPNIEVKLPQVPEKGEQTIESTVALAASQASGCVIRVKKGKLDLFGRDRSVWRFRGIHARIGLAENRLEIDMTCKSNLWEEVTFDGWLDLQNLDGNGRIELTHFQPHLLAQHLTSFPSSRVVDSKMDVSLNIATKGLQVLLAEFEGSIPYLTFHRGSQEWVMKGKSLNGSFQWNKDEASVTFSEVRLDNPQLNVSGKLRVDQASRQISLALEGRDVDVHSTWEAALAVAGDNAPIQSLSNVVRRGKVPLISLHATGDSFADLRELKNIVIKGSMADGQIFVPGADLDLQGVKGEVTISNGILEARNLQARHGESFGRHGTLKLGLQEENAPLHLDIMMQADLAQLSILLKDWVGDASFVRELNLIEDVKGKATGRLVLEGSTESIKTRVDVSEFHLFAHYARMPSPLKIDGGYFSYDKRRITVKDLKAELEGFSLSEVAGQIHWTEGSYLDIASGKSQISLGKIYPWLSSIVGTDDRLKTVGTMDGVVSISEMSLKGPLFTPEEWDFKITGDVHKLAVEGTFFPKPIAVSQGTFVLLPDKASFTASQTDILDARLHVAGTLYGYLQTIQKTNLTFQGEIGPDATQWVSGFASLPRELHLQAPLSVLEALLVWEKDVETSFSGKLVVQNGPKVSADVLHSSQGLMLKDLSIQDGESSASLNLYLTKTALGLKFVGHLTRRTIEDLLVETEFPHGWIRGEFKVNIMMDEPLKSTAHGKLMGEDLIFPLKSGKPLAINSIALVAKGNDIDIMTARVTRGDHHVVLEGHVDVSEEGWRLDLGLETDSVDWDNVREILAEASGEKTDVKEAGHLWNLPVKGNIRLRSGQFRYGTLTWSPFHGEISLNGERVRLVVNEANLCGISTPGTINILPQELQLHVKPVTKDHDLDHTLTCLGNEEKLMTGRFDFQMEVMAQGKKEELMKSLDGNIGFLAKNGRIYRYGLFAKIIAFLNVTEVFKGKMPDVVKKGFAYNSITAKGELKQGQLLLKEFILDGASMQIVCEGNIDLANRELDLKVLVAPFKTVDSVVKRIPVVGYLLGGSVACVPMKATGSLTDPRVTYLDASAVGSGLVGVMKRAVRFPVNIFSPKEQSN